MKKAITPSVFREFASIAAAGGVDMPLSVNGVVVGRVHWDLMEAAGAIFDAVRDAPGVDDDTLAVSAVTVSNAIGFMLRTDAESIARVAAMAPFSALSSLKNCRGCGRSFIPGWDRKRAKLGGPPSSYCSALCQKNKSKRTKTATEKAADERARRERKVETALALSGVKMKEVKTSAKLVRKLSRERPDLFAIYQKHMLGKHHARKRAAKPGTE